MPDFNSKGERIISIVRVLEYRGSEAWIVRTMEASRIPMQGEFKGAEGRPLPDGHSIRSGLVVWQVEPVEQEPVRQVIPLPPGSTSIQ